MSPPQSTPIRSVPVLLRRLALVAGLALCGPILALGVAAAQDEAPKKDPLAGRTGPLYLQEPYDRIVLNAANSNRELIVEPVDFPGRTRPAEPKKTDRIKIVMLGKPDEEYTVSWASIASLELFEEMVLAEANQFTTAGKSAPAYESFEFLLENHPQLPGLEQSVQRYLFFEAARIFREGRYTEALAVLEELYQRNPNYLQESGKPLTDVMGAVIDPIIGQYVQSRDYNSARKILSRLIEQYGPPLAAATDKWRLQFERMALAKKNEAIAFVREERYREANDAVKEMLRIWPDLEGAEEFAVQVAQRYPLLIVGVSQLPAAPDPLRLDNWADRRAGRLCYRTLLEFTGQGPEGGEYGCPFGRVWRSNDGRQLFLEISPEKLNMENAPVTGYDVAHQFQAMTRPGSPSYSAAWSELATGIDVDKVMKVAIALRQPHLMPEAYLTQKVGGEAEAGSSAWVPYTIASRTADEVRYVLNPAYGAKTATQPREIIERRFEFPEMAVEALLAGDIDMIDRVPPRAIPQLQSAEGVTLRRYVAPTLHLLTVNENKEYLKSRTFRRAILTALDRQTMLDLLVLENVPLEGYRVLSGPFPAGVRENDPMAYAYDEQIPPHMYSPPLAAVLAALAQREMELIAEKKKVEPLQREKLILAHAPSYLPKLVCEAIAKQLNAVGIECELRALAPGQTRADDDNWHLLYTQIMVREPIVDARTILGPGGLAGSQNPYVNLALRDLDLAVNWSDAGQRLRALHRVVHDELTVLPLFQTVDYLAHRNSVAGVPAQPVTLYQDIESWQLQPKLSK